MGRSVGQIEAARDPASDTARSSRALHIELPLPAVGARQAAITMGCLFFFLAVAAVYDDPLLHWLNQFALRSASFDKTIAWLQEASIVKFGPFAMALCVCWFVEGPTKAARRQVVVQAVVGALLAIVIGRVLALGLPFRPRPFSRPELMLHLPEAAGRGLRTWSAFPSDHAVMAFALAVSLWRVSSRLALFAAIHGAIFVCLPRIYMGLHHPSDVLGGAVVGTALALFVGRSRWMAGFTTKVIGWAGVWPGAFYATGFLLLHEIVEMFESFREIIAAVMRILRAAIG